MADQAPMDMTGVQIANALVERIERKDGPSNMVVAGPWCSDISE